MCTESHHNKFHVDHLEVYGSFNHKLPGDFKKDYQTYDHILNTGSNHIFDKVE